jgi:hypothetical protein
MYRLQKMNLVIATDKETKRDALKDQGYMLLEDITAAEVNAAEEAKAAETPDAKEKAASADKK